MNCPSCKSYSLKPTQLQAGLPSMTCTRCGGHSVNLLSYRNWQEQNIKLTPPKKPSSITTENSSQALICQKCSKIMHKYSISGEHDNKVDICTTCDEVWLDQGEWQLLVQLELHNKLTDVITAPWQSNMRKLAAEKNYQDTYRDMLGSKDFEKLKDFKDWLEDHPHEFEIMNFLRN